MKKKYYLGLFAIGLVVPIVFLTLFFSMEKGAMLTFPQSRYDYGEIGYNETVNLKLDFVNDGDKLLRIHKINPSCKCIMSKFEKRTYKPGEHGQIEVEFVANKGPGHFITHTLAFESNDYKKPIRVINLMAKMKPSLTVFPREIFLGSVRLCESYTEKIVISPFGESKEFKITSVTTNVPSAEVSFSMLKNYSEIGISADYVGFSPDTSYMVLFKLLPQRTLGNISGKITIMTTNKSSPTIIVPVQGEVISNFVINPQMLFFNLTEEAMSLNKTITIANKSPFELVIPNNHPHLQLSTECQFPTKEFTFFCTVKDRCLTQNTKGILQLNVKGHHCEDKLFIPYSIVMPI